MKKIKLKKVKEVGPLTVEKLINILKHCKHKRKAAVTFISGNDHYDIKRVGQFQIVPDVEIELKWRS